MAWTGNTVHLFVNGLLCQTLQKANNLVLPRATLILGRYPGDNTSNPLVSGYIRNFQLSSRPLIFSVPFILSYVQPFGDSYADTQFFLQPTAYDMEKALVMDQQFRKLGMRMGNCVAQSFGGRKVIGSGNPALYLIDNVPTALLNSPTAVIFQAGANDLTQTGTLDKTAFTNGMHAIIEKFMGVNGNPFTYTKKMVICSTPWAPQYPDAAQALLRQPDITSINTIQSGMSAWFDAAYPSKAGSVKYFDMFSHFGGFNPNPLYFGAGDLLHPGPMGRYMMGDGWFKGMLPALR